MSGRRFTSAFAADLDAYLAFKQNMGFYGNSRIWYLTSFDAWCSQHGRTVFDKDTVEGWVSARLESSGRYRSWMSYIRDFGRWLQATGASDAYVLSGRWKAPFVAPRPYLLASRQKARALQAGQVDLDHGHIDVVWSKGNRSRRLPVTTQVAGILAACDRESRAHFPERRPFFVSAAGNQVTPCTVGQVFARIWDQAGLARPAGGRQPRPYDFRHHFAYACIERWMRQGKDVTAMLPYLSRYMGHASFDSTYYYVHTSPDFLDAYAEITANSQSLLPEVGFG